MPGSPQNPENKDGVSLFQVLTIISECPPDKDVYICKICDVYWVGLTKCWNCGTSGMIIASGARYFQSD